MENAEKPFSSWFREKFKSFFRLCRIVIDRSVEQKTSGTENGHFSTVCARDKRNGDGRFRSVQWNCSLFLFLLFFQNSLLLERVPSTWSSSPASSPLCTRASTAFPVRLLSPPSCSSASGFAGVLSSAFSSVWPAPRSSYWPGTLCAGFSRISPTSLALGSWDPVSWPSSRPWSVKKKPRKFVRKLYENAASVHNVV